MEKMEWIICPICANKTRLKIREETILENFHSSTIGLMLCTFWLSSSSR